MTGQRLGVRDLAIGRHGSIRARQQPSDFQKLPMPATMCWSRRPSPNVRVWIVLAQAAQEADLVERRRRHEVRPEPGEARIGAHARRGQQIEDGAVELDHLVGLRGG